MFFTRKREDIADTTPETRNATVAWSCVARLLSSIPESG
jgi:hypothetical protein